MNDDELFTIKKGKSENPELRYSREARLKTAPETVQKLHRGEYTKKVGLIKRLFSTPAHGGLALAILVMLFFIPVYLKATSNAQKTANFEAKLVVTKDSSEKDLHSNTIFANVEFSFLQENFEGEEITVLFFVLDSNDIVLAHETVTTIAVSKEQIISVALNVKSTLEKAKTLKAQVESFGSTLMLIDTL